MSRNVKVMTPLARERARRRELRAEMVRVAELVERKTRQLIEEGLIERLSRWLLRGGALHSKCTVAVQRACRIGEIAPENGRNRWVLRSPFSLQCAPTHSGCAASSSGYGPSGAMASCAPSRRVASLDIPRAGTLLAQGPSRQPTRHRACIG
jgi:hypothetical protein